MVPKPFKSQSSQLQEAAQLPQKEWNPATVYIILGLLVGSQAIQTLWLKQDKGHKLRRAEAKIGTLEEIIRRVQSGEDVDVEKLLGTGDPEKEREWAEGMFWHFALWVQLHECKLCVANWVVQ